MSTPSYSDLQWHRAIELFDYNPAVDWALELIRQGRETENVLILASFSKPVDREEIQPYVSAALRELGVEEKYDAHSPIANIHYHLAMILEGHQTRRNLHSLHRRHLYIQGKWGLRPFFLLYHAWIDLEEGQENWSYEGATLANIEELLHREARSWISTFTVENATSRTFAS